MIWNVLYCFMLVVVFICGTRQQNKTKATWKAVQKQTHTDEIRWSASQRQALMRESDDERNAREYRAACAAYDERMRVKPPIG